MKRLITIITTLFLISNLVAQVEWPAPTPESKPWSRWWWHGSSVTKAGINAELEAYQKAGLGGLELTPIYGVIGEEDQFIDYLSPQWMDMLEYTLQEAERLGLGIDMATGTGWPFGGPWVGEADACKYLAHQTYELEGGESMDEPILYRQEPLLRAVTNQIYQLYGIYKEKGEKVTGSLNDPALLADKKPLAITDLVEPVAENENLQALALDQVRFEKQLPLQSLMAFSDQGDKLDLSGKVDQNGRLNWTAPTGNWTLYAIFQGWHGKMVERAAPGGEGNVIDHFSADAITNYLARFDSVFSGRSIGTLRAFFNDSYEVDDASGQANWTPELLEAFQKKHGYRLGEHWPALFGKDVAENNVRVLSDFRETFSDLILETFTKKWAQWAGVKGKIIRNQAHGSPANILDLYAASDIPETEGTEILRIKFATSAAHVAGKKLVASESATWLDEHFLSNLADIKQNIDRYLVGGVNHVFYHGTAYSPPGEAWPGRLFYAAVHANPRNTLWRDFPVLNEYITRTQSFLQSGAPDNDVLLYFPAYDRFATPGAELLEHFDGHGPALEGTAFEANANFLQAQGYAFDFISDRQIRQIKGNGGALETGGGVYQTIVLPQCQFIPLETWEKLLNLAQGGATVIVHQKLPGSVPGLGDLDTRLQKFRALKDKLQFEEIEKGVSVAKVGKGAFLLGEELGSLLAFAKIKNESLVKSGLAYARRSYDGGRFYFITNWSEKAVDAWITLQTEAAAIVIFDPMTGKTGQAKSRPSGGGGTEAYLQLPQGGACILKTFRSDPKVTPWNYLEKAGDPISLNGNWNIEFLEGGPDLPAPLKVDTLGSWTELEGAAYQNFSGAARYYLDFSKPAGDGQTWLLDLGEVHESARVKLNGQEIGTLIGPVYRILIERSLLQESNILEIEVANLMANRIAELDRRGVFWKKFYNVNFPARRAENRGKNGLFDASGWAPLPSGLTGPVTLTPVVFREKW